MYKTGSGGNFLGVVSVRGDVIQGGLLFVGDALVTSHLHVLGPLVCIHTHAQIYSDENHPQGSFVWFTLFSWHACACIYNVCVHVVMHVYYVHHFRLFSIF